MEGQYKFDEVARSERYFTSSILYHLLVNDGFKGLKIIFINIFGEECCRNLNNDFEVVSELDPLRDGSVYQPKIKKLFKKNKRVAVPDLFLRWSDLILILEAKFFTNPKEEDLENQISLQKKAIDLVKGETAYTKCTINYALLTVLEKSENDFSDSNIILLTWDHLLEWMQISIPQSVDVSYSFSVLKKAIQRAKDELQNNTQVSYKKISSFNELLNGLPDLVEQGFIYVGFSGWEENRASISLQELKNRSHYRVSKKKWSDNWITIDRLLHRYFEVKGLL